MAKKIVNKISQTQQLLTESKIRDNLSLKSQYDKRHAKTCANCWAGCLVKIFVCAIPKEPMYWIGDYEQSVSRQIAHGVRHGFTSGDVRLFLAQRLTTTKITEQFSYYDS